MFLYQKVFCIFYILFVFVFKFSCFHFFSFCSKASKIYNHHKKKVQLKFSSTLQKHIPIKDLILYSGEIKCLKLEIKSEN